MAAAVLAEVVPDPAAKRFVASGVVVALDAFFAARPPDAQRDIRE
jgi:hypothetical protein